MDDPIFSCARVYVCQADMLKAAISIFVPSCCKTIVFFNHISRKTHLSWNFLFACKCLLNMLASSVPGTTAIQQEQCNQSAGDVFYQLCYECYGKLVAKENPVMEESLGEFMAPHLYRFS